MKILIAAFLCLPLAFSLSLPGCEKHPAPAVAAPTPKPNPLPATHQEVEYYINQFTKSPTEGLIGPVNFSSWTPEHRAVVTEARCGVENQPPYTVNLDYVGTRDQIDHYLIRISYPIPNGIGSYIRPFTYDGRNTEVWSDAEYRIGIRPRGKPTPTPVSS